MARYIDADEAKKVINGIDSYFAKFIDDIPTADVVEHKRGEWIPCNERLPEERVKVLTWISSDDDYELNHVIDSEDGEWYINGVIAWMPLPEPYSGADMRGEKDG